MLSLIPIQGITKIMGNSILFLKTDLQILQKKKFQQEQYSNVDVKSFPTCFKIIKSMNYVSFINTQQF